MNTLFLPKRSWIADGLAAAACALILAHAAALAVTARLDVLPTWRAAVLRPPSRGAPARLLDRNIFCSRCATAPSRPLSTPEAPQLSALPLILIAVMHGQGWSMAVVRDAGDGSLGVFGVGGRLRGGTITGIEPTRVFLERAGRREFLDLLGQPAGAPAPDPGTAEAGIRQTGERSYEIQRSTLESLLGNMNELARSARVIPEVKDGRGAGLRLTSVRGDGPCARLGLQNGDLISSINGLELDSVEKSIAVYGKLRSTAHLSLGLERGGRRVTLEYVIR